MRIEIEEAFQDVIARVREDVRWAWYWVVWRRPPPSEQILGIEPPEMREIIFTPLTPADVPATALPAGGTALVCPVTRQPVQPGNGAYQCTNCKMAYSPEGWEFLKQTVRGRCCGCNEKNTVVPLN